MKLRKLTIRGTIPFRDVEVPIDELGDAALVAVTGPNGAGKSTMLECVPGALYRTMPSRGLLSAVCNDAKSRVEVDLAVNGMTITADVQIDAVKGKAQAFLYGDHTDPVNGLRTREPISPPDGKIKHFVEAVARYFPPQDVYLASAFGAQSGAGRFLDLDPAERRTLLAKLIGIERWQEIADAAGVKAREAKSELDTLKGKLAALQATEYVSTEEMQTARDAVKDAKDRLEIAEETYEEQRKVADEYTHTLNEIEMKIAAARGEKDNAEKAAKEIADRLTKLRAEHETLEARLAKRAKLKELTGQETGDPDELRGKIDALNKAGADYRLACQERTAAIRDRDREIVRLQAEIGDRESRSALLASIPEDCPGGCPLIADASQASQEIGGLLAKLEEARAISVPPEPTKPGLDELAGLEKALEIAVASQKAIAEAKTALAGLEEAGARLDAVANEIMVEEERLQKAEVRSGAAAKAVEAAEEERATHAVLKPSPPKNGPKERARAALDAAKATLARLEERKAQAEKAEAGLVATQGEIEILTADLDDWTTLQKAAGPKGVQAYEIDAAAPGISGLCNELLHACYGSRYTVRLTTQAAAAKKGQTLEVCDLTVLDNERGTDGSAALKSGGERVIIGEALSLAIAIYNARRSAIPMADLFRDECAGALDGDNARQYVAMLRKALDLGGFHRVYYVSHVPDLWELADARLHVEGGKVVAK